MRLTGYLQIIPKLLLRLRNALSQFAKKRFDICDKPNREKRLLFNSSFHSSSIDVDTDSLHGRRQKACNSHRMLDGAKQKHMTNVGELRPHNLLRFYNIS